MRPFLAAATNPAIASTPDDVIINQLLGNTCPLKQHFGGGDAPIALM
jgi:hypothetical protein